MRRLIVHRAPERGAVAIIVAILFGFGVMVGAGALTIDVGNINADRRQLQNGADAAAMSAAQDCATSECPNLAGSSVAQTNYDRLVTLANKNAADGATQLARVDSHVAPGGSDPRAVCGTLDGLPSCTPDVTSLSNLQECPGSPVSSSVKYVRVYTQTLNQSRTKTLLPYSFGAAIAGGGQGANQQACASVGVGTLGSSPDTLPIVIAKCAYDTMKAKNGFPPMDPNPGASQTLVPVPLFPTQGGVPDSSGVYPTVDYAKYVMTIWSHISGGEKGPTKCDDTSPSGLYLPGGFGWTTTTDDTQCTADFNSDTGTVPISNGAAIPQGCKNIGTSPMEFVGTTVNIPIMTGITADGKSYIIDGLAGFYVAGYSAPAANPKSYDGYRDNGTIKIPKLAGGDDGFWGWFTDQYVTKDSSFGQTLDSKGPKLIKYIE